MAIYLKVCRTWYIVFVGLKCLTETKIQILSDHVDYTRFHIVEMGCQMVQYLLAHIAGTNNVCQFDPTLALANMKNTKGYCHEL